MLESIERPGLLAAGLVLVLGLVHPAAAHVGPPAGATPASDRHGACTGARAGQCLAYGEDSGGTGEDGGDDPGDEGEDDGGDSAGDDGEN